MKSAEIDVIALESIAEVESLLQQDKTPVLVHALQDFERGETSQFHHSLCRTNHGAEMLRFMIYRNNNMRAVAFSLDLGMQKAMAQDRAAHTIGHTVNLALQAMKNRDELQKQGLALAASGSTTLSEEEMLLIDKVYKAFPTDLSIRTAQARVLLMRRQFPMAIELSKRILQAEPYAVRAMTILGEVEAALGQHELALKLILKAHEFAGGNPDRMAILARMYVDLGQYSEAKKFVLEGMRLYPHMKVLREELQKVPLNGPEVFEMLSLVKAHLQGQALTDFAFGLTKPLILLRQFDFVADAISASLSQLEEKDQQCDYLFRTATELRDMGARSEAMTQLTRCLQINPKFPGAGDMLLKIKTNLVA